MQKRQLGNSSMEITPIGFGAWAIGGGGWAYAWGSQDDEQSIRAIQHALDLGINWIDTAAVYGLGHSEEIVARALKGRSERPYIFTKCSMIWNDKKEISQSLKADSVRRECEASLRRLQCDAIDLYQIHWPNPDADVEEGWSAMAKLQQEGKVRHIGVSNFSVEQMRRCQRIAPITSLQPPYNILTPWIEKEILPYTAEQHIGVIVYSPMKSGLLTGAMTRERALNLPADDWRRNNREFQEPRLSRNLGLVDLMRSIAARHGRTPGEVAIAWTLRQQAVTAAIVGARSAAQIDGVIGAMEYRLAPEEIQEIETYVQTKIVGQ
jgi:aryl-alcohol dehydrogenase-like predicted oxidoreductase